MVNRRFHQRILPRSQPTRTSHAPHYTRCKSHDKKNLDNLSVPMLCPHVMFNQSHIRNAIQKMLNAVPFGSVPFYEQSKGAFARLFISTAPLSLVPFFEKSSRKSLINQQ
jgi:hypothetical protein